ncbi:MAG TPA: DUF3135 domain-containing protein [Zoogloea sp.]|uniref:DUF3135 domain-containing protein n=1 Tax=Zoogloea sp. TaxID=49181 RepID=UPI002C23AEC2|nr:DUF3135 domain-containing protein [Zoogloea sp.]HOB46175.1 DUF3135 domain-containing protein [Zoogloea sp.]HQA09972.1 DUF3135 domain-containing protein [Zoogloea sp.]HQE41016.1 DUF3135 domain-containing protein [Zoogloea sp.]
MGGFDFDYWKDLAEKDPPAFFRARDEALRECIAMHPGQEGVLAELQARIDSIRVLSGTPLQASRELFGLMEEQLVLLGLKLKELQRETEGLRDTLCSQPGRVV